MSLISSLVSRVSTVAVREEMQAQLQRSQSTLSALQRQLSTGVRLRVPSDDLPAATRGMQLQRLLEQKEQMGVNLREATAFLDVTDAALSDSGDLLARARGFAVQAIDSGTDATQREAIALELESIVQRFLQLANTKFQGRYLFAGSDPTVLPYEDLGGRIVYRGNEKSLRTIADFESLIDTNVAGADVFGGLSQEVRPDSDYNPVLRESTLLSELRGGLGVELGSVRISDGSQSSTVDLSSAATVGDVARLLADGAPPGRELTVDITPSGLMLQLDAAGGGNLTVTEVDGGRTAEQLGILEETGTGTDPLVGADINPRLRWTTPIRDILGVKARALLRSPGRHNDIAIEANDVGAAANGYAIQLVNDGLLQAAPGLNPGNEYAVFEPAPVAARAALTLSGSADDLVLTATTPGTSANGVTIELVAAPLGGDLATASYDAANKKMTITIDDADQTTVGTLVAAINAQGMFTATADPSMGEAYNPTQVVSAADAGSVQGYTGNSGGDGNTFFVHVSPLGSKSQDVVNALNSLPDFNSRFTAQLAALDETTPSL
ncbi:MAG TPA: flagellar hook-associated protein 3, partial [Planctomycetaceae bacterium]|nr:flagellar hook-associated protein 3 [Planctomycetaceae bacterium]